jgi:hypothetical protein
VLVGGFVDNYMIWMYHGEKAPSPIENPLDEIIQDAEFNRLFDAYDDFDDAGSDDEDVGGGYGAGVDGGHIDGGSDDSSDDELDEGFFEPVVASHQSGATGW